MTRNTSFKELLNDINIEEYALIEQRGFAKADKPVKEEAKKVNMVQVLMYHVKGYASKDIAEILNVKLDTIKHIKRTDDFKMMVQSLISEVVSAGRMFLSTAGMRAVKTLIDLLQSPNDKVRLQASMEILNRIGLKSPDKLEIVTKGDAIRQMDEKELMNLVKLGMDEILKEHKG